MKVFDYVIVGGGSSGCVVASRLSEDESTSVVLLEAGGRGDEWIVRLPTTTFAMVASTKNNWAFETVPQAGLNGRRGYQPRGKVLGGSSAINVMVYIRGNRSDYDNWAAAGNAGWSYNEVLPYFKRAESNNQFDDHFHGRSGPLSVSRLQTDNAFQDVFLQAAKEAGYPLRDDFNGIGQEGLGVFQVTQVNGERCSAARAYIEPFLKTRRNLAVELNAYATRILFDGKRAVGVEYRRGDEIEIVHARREVIISAGVFQSPQILMLSGVGPAAELQRHGIQVLHDLPGVGENLHDQPDFVFDFTADHPGLYGFAFQNLPWIMSVVDDYVNSRRGPISSNFAECGGFLKTSPNLETPDIQLHFGAAMIEDHGRKPHNQTGFACHCALLNPKSRGTLRLQSADPEAAPMIDPNFLGEADDLERMVLGYKLTRRLMESPALKNLIKEDLVTADVRTDDDIREVIRNKADTVYHPVGTCKMGVDTLAVVDPELRVHGLESLRVIDASVMPSVVSGNTGAAAIMIGEKGAEMIGMAARKGE